MPHADFDAARREHDETFEPVTFALCGEVFTAQREPTWGDILALADAPEVPQDEAGALLALHKFIRSMVELDDRVRFDAAMFRLPGTQAGTTMFNVAAYITTHMTGFPTMPPGNSSSGPESTGSSSPASTGGDTSSPTPDPTSEPPSSTGTSPDDATSPNDGRSIES